MSEPYDKGYILDRMFETFIAVRYWLQRHNYGECIQLLRSINDLVQTNKV